MRITGCSIVAAAGAICTASTNSNTRDIGLLVMGIGLVLFFIEYVRGWSSTP